jgi:Protein of unknown function (DUF3300)
MATFSDRCHLCERIRSSGCDGTLWELLSHVRYTLCTNSEDWKYTMTLILHRKMARSFWRGTNASIGYFCRASHSVTVHVLHWARAGISVLLICCLVPLSTVGLYAQQYPPARSDYLQLTYAQLDQLVAPIALYPDTLVAQILTAAT